MQFSYIAAEKAGTKKKGTIDAGSEKEVVDFLRKKGLVPITIKNKESSNLIATILLRQIRTSDIVLFTRQLSSMILSGLTVIEALSILRRQTTKIKMAVVIDDLIANISEGKSFSEALSNHRGIFSEVYISLIKAAETGGILDKVLERLAANLERSEDLRKQIRSALFYPAIIIVGITGVIIIMNVFVMPQLGTLYESLGLDLPITTRIVLGFSELTRRYILVIIILAVVAFIGLRKANKTPKGRLYIDKYKLKIPIIGAIIKLSILDEISRTLSLLVSSGTSILEALSITARVADNVLYRNALNASEKQVEKGVHLSQSLQNQHIFPPILVQMTKVGESTGKIDENLLKVSEYFERDLELKIKTLTSSIEPILIIVLGATVAFLIISVITPIYSLVTQLQ